MFVWEYLLRKSGNRINFRKIKSSHHIWESKYPFCQEIRSKSLTYEDLRRWVWKKVNLTHEVKRQSWHGRRSFYDERVPGERHSQKLSADAKCILCPRSYDIKFKLIFMINQNMFYFLSQFLCWFLNIAHLEKSLHSFKSWLKINKIS